MRYFILFTILFIGCAGQFDADDGNIDSVSDTGAGTDTYVLYDTNSDDSIDTDSSVNFITDSDIDTDDSIESKDTDTFEIVDITDTTDTGIDIKDTNIDTNIDTNTDVNVDTNIDTGDTGTFEVTDTTDTTDTNTDIGGDTGTSISDTEEIDTGWDTVDTDTLTEYDCNRFHEYDIWGGHLIDGHCWMRIPDDYYDHYHEEQNCYGFCDEIGFKYDIATDWYLSVNDQHCTEIILKAGWIYWYDGWSFIKVDDSDTRGACNFKSASGNEVRLEINKTEKMTSMGYGNICSCRPK